MENIFYTILLLFICKLSIGQLGHLKASVTNSEGQPGHYGANTSHGYS